MAPSHRYIPPIGCCPHASRIPAAEPRLCSSPSYIRTLGPTKDIGLNLVLSASHGQFLREMSSSSSTGWKPPTQAYEGSSLLELRSGNSLSPALLLRFTGASRQQPFHAPHPLVLLAPPARTPATRRYTSWSTRICPPPVALGRFQARCPPIVLCSIPNTGRPPPLPLPFPLPHSRSSPPSPPPPPPPTPTSGRPSKRRIPPLSQSAPCHDLQVTAMSSSLSPTHPLAMLHRWGPSRSRSPSPQSPRWRKWGPAGSRLAVEATQAHRNPPVRAGRGLRSTSR